VREMVAAVPEIQTLKRILVLFNIEFLECLIKERGIDPATVDFGYDSEIEGAIAERVYGAHAFSIGKSLLDMQLATSGNAGVYDVVFSNPPYQEQSEAQKDMEGFKSHASPIYNKIVEYVIDVLCPQYVCMITPSRWMVGGRGLDDYRARMRSDKHLRLIVDFPGSSTVFTEVGIAGGVSYFLWDKDYSGPCSFNGTPRSLDEFDLVVRDNTSANILRKILLTTNKFRKESVLSTNFFGLNTNFDGWVEPSSTSIKCYTNKREVKHAPEGSCAKKQAIRAMCKVLGSRGTGHNGEIFSKEKDNVGYRNVFLADKDSICTQTWLILGCFETKRQAENFLAYTQAKFFQFMLSFRIGTTTLCSDSFAWVPDLGDYTNPINDEDLYAHFKLTKKEQEHIEKSIKAL